jgi:hypothetical protein
MPKCTIFAFIAKHQKCLPITSLKDFHMIHSFPMDIIIIDIMDRVNEPDRKNERYHDANHIYDSFRPLKFDRDSPNKIAEYKCC